VLTPGVRDVQHPLDHDEGGEADLAARGQLTARLVWAEDTVALAGAELVVGSGWAGLRGHPGPVSTVSYGGPEIPDLVQGPLREAVIGPERPLSSAYLGSADENGDDR